MDPIFWSIILLLLGMATIFLELFVPSAGMLGVVAVTFIAAAIVVAFISSPLAGAIMLLVTGLSLPLLIAVALKVWPHTPIGRRILIGRANEDEVLPQRDEYEEIRSLEGRRGIAKTKMLPSGLVVIDDNKYDAVSDGFAIEAGDPIEVVAIRANRIFVRPLDPDEDWTATSSDPDDILSQPIDQLGIDPIDESSA